MSTITTEATADTIIDVIDDRPIAAVGLGIFPGGRVENGRLFVTGRDEPVTGEWHWLPAPGERVRRDDVEGVWLSAQASNTVTYLATILTDDGTVAQTRVPLDYWTTDHRTGTGPVDLTAALAALTGALSEQTAAVERWQEWRHDLVEDMFEEAERHDLCSLYDEFCGRHDLPRRMTTQEVPVEVTARVYVTVECERGSDSCPGEMVELEDVWAQLEKSDIRFTTDD